MANQNHDKVFMINFGAVLAVLFGIFFICIIAARLLDTGEGHADAAALARLEARIKPAGTVVTDPAVLVKAAAAAQAARPAMSGEEVYGKVCTGCHATGVMNAPKVGDKAVWGERLKTQGGVDGLVQKAISGLNAMPPRGGDGSLSDDEIKGAVEHMLKQTGL
ncbi:Cytochrome c5 [Solimonas aquatica]|uniref:Cytochrome c5 n=2 Tax=Solimonas aquatica TaxID=489703 RepID=A0A1H9GTB1_9GAMM|nr:Cytochrome c5 [Solimonas aquatica]